MQAEPFLPLLGAHTGCGAARTELGSTVGCVSGAEPRLGRVPPAGRVPSSPPVPIAQAVVTSAGLSLRSSPPKMFSADPPAPHGARPFALGKRGTPGPKLPQCALNLAPRHPNSFAVTHKPAPSQESIATGVKPNLRAPGATGCPQHLATSTGLLLGAAGCWQSRGVLVVVVPREMGQGAPWGPRSWKKKSNQIKNPHPALGGGERSNEERG